MSQEEVTNVFKLRYTPSISIAVKNVTRMKRKRGGALSTRGCYAVDSAYCRRHVDLKYATGPHNNQIPGLESTIYLQIKDES